MKLTNFMVTSAVLLALPACGTETANRTASLALSGSVDTASFGGNVDAVRAIQGSNVVSETTLNADGTFALKVPEGTGYKIDFTYGSNTAGLVFPRQAGTVEHLFDVTGDGAFDLGTVHYIGDPASQSYQFHTATAALEAADGECENGMDAITGAVCVDDDNSDEQCADDDADGETNDDGVDCVDGIDSATGAECDGGPSANQDDGETNDIETNDDETNDDETNDGETNDDETNDDETNDDETNDDETNDDAPADAAVADHNLPSVLGCAVEDGEEADD